MMTNEAGYEKAVAAHRAAFAAHEEARKAYRAREIGDAEYLAARKAMTDALHVLDVLEGVAS
jgi:hypothetical protein